MIGPTPPKGLPKQDYELILMLGTRWQRAKEAMREWAPRGKEAVDFFEGRQYTEDQLAVMRKSGRLALKFNKIGRLVRLVMGYHSGNASDITFKPGQDSLSSEQVAEALNKVEKSEASNMGLEYVDEEVFLDGLVAGRGWFDTRLDFEKNDLGEMVTRSLDPFATYVDPDADTYDLNDSSSYMIFSQMYALEEIEAEFGKRVSEHIRPFTNGQTPVEPITTLNIEEDISPVRTFAERQDSNFLWWDAFYGMLGDFVDTYRKTIRVLEVQHKIRERRNVMIDLETGDKVTLPTTWGRMEIEKALMFAQQMNNPCVVERRNVEAIQWTTFAGDVILYNDRSMYDRFTMTGYFPYFRRGYTKGMVDDLIDPQKEKNKRRSNLSEIVSKTANGGWMFHQDSLDPDQEANLRKYGAMPGVNIKWKGEIVPAQIQPNNPNMQQERLELKSDDDLQEISGVNESAMGELDRVQSGRAIEARQRQAVLSISSYLKNFKRTKEILGRQHLYIIQNYYTEPRIFRITGEDGKDQQVAINQPLHNPISGAISKILNDVTLGHYMVKIDQRPLSETFLNAQFEEMMMLLEKLAPAIGPQLPLFADLIIGMSSMPRKDEWVQRIQMLQGAMGLPGGAMGAGGLPPAGAGALPAGAPAGQPTLAPPSPVGGSPPARSLNGGSPIPGGIA